MAFHGMIGRKLGMTQIFTDEGNAVAVTVLEMQPNAISQVRTEEVDGYNAIQLAFGSRKEKNLTKPVIGHLKKAGVAGAQRLREFRVPAGELEGYKAGGSIGVDVLEGVDHIDVAATSKGHGFTGVVVRHNFAGCNTMTHGTHEAFRHGGSIGMGTFPGRVFKGKKMAGQMGNKRVTVQSLKIIRIDTERNLVLVRGGVPGARNAVVEIRPAVKK
ncbi:MAG: 50S ribosomal protein L3 [Myxococcota bacterium]|jgi:large subunit ribosomal protein L3|nr:50S ribosomal protein L3 [Myxococcota bacterium]